MMFRLFLISIGFLIFSCSSLLNPLNNDSVANDNNGTIALAEPINVGTTTTFTLPTTTDVDFYKITLTNDGLLRLKCSNVPSNMRIYMELQDPEGTVLSSAYTSYGIDDSICFSAAIGVYYLRLKDYYSQDSSSSPITLSIQIDTVDTFETNNNIANAKPILLENSYFSKIIPLADEDFFEFSLSQPSIIICKIDSVSSKLQIYTEILNSEGVVVTSNTATANGAQVEFSKSLLQGSYYLRIKCCYNRDFSDKPYVFKLTKYTNDTCEWNDSSTSAKAINGVMVGTIYPLGDIDFFSFSRSDSGKTTLTVDSVSTRVNIYMELFNSEKVIIVSTYGNLGAAVSLESGLRAGNYFVRIKDAYSDDYADKKYYLTMQNN